MATAVQDDLTPGGWDFTRVRGDLMRPTTFTVVLDAAPAITAPVAQVRVRKDSGSTLVLDLDATVVGNNIVVGDGVALNVDPGTYWWDLQVSDLTVVAGTFRVLNDVSEVVL